MATGRISKRAVDAAEPGERDTYLWDAELAGFALKVTPAGGKTYLVQYRLGGRKGRTRRVTLGRHGPLTPEQARHAARRVLGEVAAGRDPAEAKSEKRRDVTVAELCDLYLAEGVATKKTSTQATDRGRIERHLKPLLGRKKAGAVTRGDVERLMQDVAAGATAARERTGPRGLARVTGGRGTASKAVSLLSAIYNFAIDRDLCADNPARGVKKFRERKFERFLSPAELARLGEALAAAEQEGTNPSAVAAIRLLTLTGCRRGEILTLQWDFIDWQRACLRLPDSKTGAKVVPLGAPALELLASLPRVDGNPYVLPSGRGGHLVGLQSVWTSIRERAGLPRLRVHDLRHSYASVGAAGGDSLVVIGALLGHRDQATTQRYAHLSNDPVRTAADRIANEIARAMRGEGGQPATLTGAPGGITAVTDDGGEPEPNAPRSRTA